jgi:hypothetical protein
MTEQLANLALSGLVLVVVTILALAGVVDDELVALVVGAVLPSPTKAAASRLVRARRPLQAPPPGG